jgi:hypothetical protein
MVFDKVKDRILIGNTKAGRVFLKTVGAVEKVFKRDKLCTS